MVEPDRTIPASWDWGDRFPSLLSGPGGTLSLAYLSYLPDAYVGQLHIAPLRIDPATGDPSAEPRGLILAGDCLRTPPAPSADGRWVCCVVRPNGSGPEVIRLDVAELRRRPSLGETSDGSAAQ